MCFANTIKFDLFEFFFCYTFPYTRSISLAQVLGIFALMKYLNRVSFFVIPLALSGSSSMVSFRTRCTQICTCNSLYLRCDGSYTWTESVSRNYAFFCPDKSEQNCRCSKEPLQPVPYMQVGRTHSLFPSLWQRFIRAPISIVLTPLDFDVAGCRFFAVPVFHLIFWLIYQGILGRVLDSVCM